jgi:hypothetical protein
VFYQSLETCILNIESNSKCYFHVSQKLMWLLWLLKSPLDDLSIVILKVISVLGDT